MAMKKICLINKDFIRITQNKSVLCLIHNLKNSL